MQFDLAWYMLGRRAAPVVVLAVHQGTDLGNGFPGQAGIIVLIFNHAR